MSENPPPFQEASRCDVCQCSFTTFRRRHHCRCCGRTLCHEHSSYHMTLPQYGIYSNVRVCYECFNKSSSTRNVSTENSSEAVNTATENFSRIKLGEDSNSSNKGESKFEETVKECKCGMPLCICEAPKPEPAPVPVQYTTTSTVQSNPRPKKPTNTQAESSTRKTTASSSSNSSSCFNLGQTNNISSDKGQSDYDVSGEGLREAIKNGDARAVRNLLSAGVDANYCDKQGFTLLHLAALFNQTEIALILMDSGANVESKNAQGETPLDCAPTMLQYKMRQRIEELNKIAS